METKICSRCKIKKPVDDFFRSSMRPDGRTSHCKVCYYLHYRKNPYGGGRIFKEGRPVIPKPDKTKITSLWRPESSIYQKKPVVRADCIDESRPCPWLSCKYHVITAWHRLTLLKMSDREIENLIYTLPATCILDVADQGGATLKEIADVMGITRERVRQLSDFKNREGGALQRMRHVSRRRELELFRWRD